VTHGYSQPAARKERPRVNRPDEEERTVKPLDRCLKREGLGALDELAEETVLENFVEHDPSLPDLGRDPPGWKELAHQVVIENPHVYSTIDDFFGEGDKTASRGTMRLTSASTAKTVNLPVLVITHWIGNKAIEEWELAGPPEEQP
jgi:hypothetical protein